MCTKGQGHCEYGLLLVGVAIVAIVVVWRFSPQMTALLERIGR